MASKIKSGGRLLAFFLPIFFLWQVIISVNKLREEKIAVSTTKQYDKSRLMPSFSLCFRYRKVQPDANLNKAISTNGTGVLAQATLNDARKVF